MTKPTQDMSEQEREELAKAAFEHSVNWTKPHLPQAEMEALQHAFELGAKYQQAKDAKYIGNLQQEIVDTRAFYRHEASAKYKQEITSLRAELAESRDDCQHLKMLLDAANQELADAKEKLEVAIEALQYYGSNDNWFKELGQGIDLFPKEFRLIDDVDVREIKDNGRSSSVGGKRAVEALAKLRGKKVVG